jgi:hypothetical protein
MMIAAAPFGSSQTHYFLKGMLAGRRVIASAISVNAGVKMHRLAGVKMYHG